MLLPQPTETRSTEECHRWSSAAEICLFDRLSSSRRKALNALRCDARPNAAVVGAADAGDGCNWKEIGRIDCPDY